MGVLDRFEKSVERVVNHAFARVGRSEVKPVELASALRRLRPQIVATDPGMRARAALDVGRGKTFGRGIARRGGAKAYDIGLPGMNAILWHDGEQQ